MGIELREPGLVIVDVRADFMQACIVHPDTAQKFPDSNAQRIAFCSSQWVSAHESLTPEAMLDILLEATSSSFPTSPLSPAGLLATERYTKAMEDYFTKLYGSFPFAKFSAAYVKALNTGVKESRYSFSFLQETGIGADLEVVLATWVKSEFELLEQLSIEGIDQGQKVGWRAQMDVFAKDSGVTSPFSSFGFIPQVNQASLKAAKERAGELVTGISNSTRSQLGNIIEEGLRKQWSVDDIASKLSDVLGDSDGISKRARVIGRTETNRALGAGSKNAATQVGAKEKEWVTVADRRVNQDICLPNEGQGRIGISGNFQSGHDAQPGHPSCRCVVTYFGANLDKVQASISSPIFGPGKIPGVDVLADSTNAAIVAAKNLTRQAQRQIDDILKSRKALTDDYKKVWADKDNIPKSELDKKGKLFREKMRDIDKKMAEIRDGIFDDITGAIVENPNDIRVAGEKATKGLRSKFEDLTNKAFDEKTTSGLMDIEFTKDKTKRAWYDNGMVHGNGSTNPETFLHEFGHHLEDNNERIRDLVIKFRKGRIGNEELRTLREITKRNSYGQSEKAWKDNFFDAYVGRFYREGSTEILSMGIEAMYKNPLLFLQQDPEHFELILRIMGGFF